LRSGQATGIFIDEFQNFISTDIKEIFAEGRKFGARLCVAHQRPDQLPKDLFSAALSAKTKICFRVTEAAGQLAPVFIQEATKVRKEDISPKPAEYFLTYGHEHPDVSYFIKQYLRPVSLLPKRFEVSKWEASYGMAEFTTDFVFNVLGSPAPCHDKRPIVDNPLPYLNELLREVQVKGDATLEIPIEVILGFSDCGVGYYKLLEKLKRKHIFILAEAKNPRVYYDDLPGKKEHRAELLDFLSSLRAVMAVLAQDPIGEKRTDIPSEVTQKIMHLPNREALVSTGEKVYHMRTHDTSLPTPDSEQTRNWAIMLKNTLEYVRRKEDVELHIQARLGVKEDEEADAKDASGSVAGAEPEPIEVPEPETQLPAPPTQRAPEEQTRGQIPASMDTMNVLYAQMKARAIDPDTTILASLGEHYVLTIKQWMRLFAWGSYPRATQYFKELREEGWIYHKDREGRGGKLVEGDWFFLLTKGANELVKRKQPSPLFTLEPNEAQKASGDTLVHTSLVNEVLIHLRLLEREQPDIIRIEGLDHERSMRRTYLAALADSKLYPDGFLRLLVPTPNGLKRRHTFLELQHTTQKDEAAWKTKCRKYLALFEQTDILGKFFSTKTPQVLVITMNEEYVLHHEKWTEEVLQEAGARGREYSSRFIIGAYDTRISDMSMSPEQFFCTPRFYAPFHDTPRSVFGT